MKKRLISIFLLISMLMSICPVNAADYNDNDVDEEYEYHCRVYEKISKNNSLPEEKNHIVTRGEFVVYLCTFLNLTSSSNEVQFADIKPESPYFGFINALCEKGAVSTAVPFFEPDRNIRLPEALKILIVLFGMGKIAEIRGEYPKAYTDIAREYGIYPKGVNPEQITFGETLQLLLDAADCPMAEFTTNGGKNMLDTHSTSSKTMLEYYREIGKVKNGFVSGIAGIKTHLGSLPENRIKIDNKVYTYDNITEPYDYYGRVADVYFEQNYSGEYENIIDIQPNNEYTKKVLGSDFNDYSSGRINYYEDKSKLKYYSIETGAEFIYNNSEVTTKISSLFTDFYKGEITLIDNDKNGKYEIVLIKSYKNGIVNFYNSTDKFVYLTDSEEAYIDASAIENIKIISSSGIEIEIEQLKNKSTILYALSKDKFSGELIVNSAVLSGVIEGFDDDDNIIIDGQRIAIDKQYYNIIKNKLSIGQTYSYIIDSYGEIVSFDSPTGQYIFAYFLKYRNLRREETAQLELYTQDGELDKFKLASKVTIDGVRIKNDYKNVLQAFPGSSLDTSGEIKIPEQVIRVKFNSEKEIVGIDTLNDNLNYTSDDLIYVDEDTTGKGVAYQHGNPSRHIIGMKLMLSSNTIVMTVPPDTSSFTEKDFSVNKGTGMFAYDHYYAITSYKTDKKADYSAFILYKKDGSTEIDDCTPMMVEKVAHVYSEELEEKLQRVYGYNGNSEIYCDFYDDVDLTKLSVGDLIRYSRDTYGVAKNYEMLYDVSVGGTPKWSGITADRSWFSSATNYRQQFQLSHGYVTFKGENVVGWGYKLPGNIDEAYDLNYTNVPIVVYDKQENKVYVGNFGNIVDYNSSKTRYSHIILSTNNTTAKVAFIYNNMN